MKDNVWNVPQLPKTLIHLDSPSKNKTPNKHIELERIQTNKQTNEEKQQKQNKHHHHPQTILTSLV